MFRGLPLHVAAGVCAIVATCAAPLHAQPNLKRWLFAEGSTNASFGFEEEILVGNPNQVPATLTLRFLKQDGGVAEFPGIVVPPLSRSGLNVRGFVGNEAGVALEILSDVDVVAERSMYWGGGLFNFGPGYNPGAITDMRGGHNVMGVNEPRTSWSFAEGVAGGPFGFQTYVLVSNPQPHTGATITVNYLTADGQTVSDVQLLPPGQRRTFWANGALPQSATQQVAFAIEVLSDNAAVVAERAVYWGPNLRGGHASAGVQPSSVAYFAEGVQGAPPFNFDTYVLLFNPNHEAIDVQVDFFGASGIAQSVTRTLQPRSRDTVWAGLYPDQLAGGEKAFSIRVLNTQGKLFVAERAVYWRGLREGTASAGITAGARKWGFADGQEGGFNQFQNPADADRRQFAAFYQILNNTDFPVSVRAVFYVEPDAAAGVTPGMGAETTVVVPARSRQTVAPATLFALHNRKFAAFFEATNEVIIERGMFWGAGIQGGHASAGAVMPDTLPLLPPPSAPPAAVVTGVTPSRGTPSGGTPVTIHGRGFGLTDSPLGQTAIYFGVTPVPVANITVNNANSITVVTPPSGKGMATLRVETRGGAAELPSAFEFFDKNAAAGQPLARFNVNGVLGLPASLGGVNFEGVLNNLAARRPGDLRNSCVDYGQGGNNNFMFESVADLRKATGSNRWGLNWKRGGIGDLSQDIVTYFWGEEGEIMRNSNKVFLVDMIFSHCGSNPGTAWQDVTLLTYPGGVVTNNARWTTDPMCGIPYYRDMMHNGQYVFPECRD
jgi:hypothetical protein